MYYITLHYARCVIEGPVWIIYITVTGKASNVNTFMNCTVVV